MVEAKPEIGEAVEHFLQGTDVPAVLDNHADYEEEPELEKEEQHHEEYEEEPPADYLEPHFDDDLDTDIYHFGSREGLESDDIPVNSGHDLDESSPTSPTLSEADAGHLHRTDSGVHFPFDEDLSPQKSPTLSIISLSLSDIDELDLDRPHTTSEPIRIAPLAGRQVREPRSRTDGNTRSATLSAYTRADFASVEDEDDGPSSFLRPQSTSRIRVGSL